MYFYEHDIENFAALFKSVHSTLVLSLNKQFQSHVVKTPPLPSNIVMNAFNYLQIRFAQRRKDANNRWPWFSHLSSLNALFYVKCC